MGVKMAQYQNVVVVSGKQEGLPKGREEVVSDRRFAIGILTRAKGDFVRGMKWEERAQREGEKRERGEEVEATLNYKLWLVLSGHTRSGG